jgi:hypothetical protein
VIFERDKALGDIGTENGRLRKVVDTDEALRELDEVAK